MPGFILHLGATVICAHGGQATPLAPFPRVLVSGQPIATLSSPYAVAGCAFPTASGGPCVTGAVGPGRDARARRGRTGLVQSGFAVCAPTGTPLTPLVMQPRVSAT